MENIQGCGKTFFVPGSLLFHKLCNNSFKKDKINWQNRIIKYNEITIIFRTFYVWLYGYYEDNDSTLYINIKYESQTTDNVIFLFEKLLTELGFKHDY